MANILVTGSLGVVGKKLVDKLKADGNTVLGVDLYHDKDENNGYMKCDIAEYRQLERVFDLVKFDYVFNCAAQFGRWNGEDYYETLWKTNAIGMKNILKFQKRLFFKLIHFSSSEVYGDFNGTMSEDLLEKVPIVQLNDYAMTKRVNEMQIRNSMIMYKTQSVIVRLFNTYGPGEYYSPYRSVNCRFCYCALSGKPITIFRGHLRTSTYLDDCVNAVANIPKAWINGGIFNIAGTRLHSIEEMAGIIWKITGADINLIQYKDSEILTTLQKRPTIELARKYLGLEDTISLEDGIAKTIEWMRNEYGFKP